MSVKRQNSNSSKRSKTTRQRTRICRPPATCKNANVDNNCRGWPSVATAPTKEGVATEGHPYNESGDSKMAEFQSVAPVFAVADIGATIRWYEEQLGFTGYPFPPQGPYVFGAINRGRIEI